MNLGKYLATAIDLFLAAADTPSRGSRRDWAIAADLYRRGVRLEQLAHASRLATLRRRSGGQHPGTFHSLAYYRAVLQRLGDDEVEPDYVAYVRLKYEALRINHTRTSQNRGGFKARIPRYAKHRIMLSSSPETPADSALWGISST